MGITTKTFGLIILGPLRSFWEICIEHPKDYNFRLTHWEGLMTWRAGICTFDKRGNGNCEVICVHRVDL